MMVTARGALARWRTHLEEVIGVEDAAEVLAPFTAVEWDRLATRDEMDDLRREMDDLRVEMRQGFAELRADAKDLRRDLLKVTGAQYFALVAAVAAVLGFS